ncbi:MAG: hypothetical protein IPP99_01455 [Chitinophagaceae bacterium]|nr:hypothetical protein [Chitinophagaceae bacterium]
MFEVRIFFLLLMALVFAPFKGLGQHIFNSFSFQQGLTSYNILKVLQDPHGFIWIATQDGLYRYNGKNFDILKKGKSQQSLSENYILDMCMGAGDSILVSTFPAGINIISSSTLISKNLFLNDDTTQKSIPVGSTWMHKIQYASNGEIWMGNDKSLLIYSPYRQKQIRISQIEGIKSPLYVTFIQPVSTNTMAIGVRNFGIALINTTSKKVENLIPTSVINNTDTVEEIVDILIVNDRVYICFEHSITEGMIKNNKWTTIRKFNIPFSRQTTLTSLAKHATDITLWYGSSSGIGKISLITGDCQTIKASPLIHSYTPNPISHLFADNQGNLWVSGSKSLQVTSLSPSPFRAFTGNPGVPLEHIYSIDTLDQSNILTTGKNGLFITNLENGFTNLVNGSGGHGTVHFAYRINKSLYIISTDDGQFLWSVHSNIFSKEALTDQFPEWKPFVNNYFNNASTFGHTAYFASEEEEGLIKWNREKHQIVQFKKGTNNNGLLPENHIHNIKPDNEGNLWLLFDSHIAMFDRLQEKATLIFPYKNGQEGPLAGIFFDAYDSKDKIWFGTYGGGLNSWDKKTKKWDYITEDNGLCNNSIYGILPENDSIIWVSTNMGISRINHHLKTCQNFFAIDGLQDNSFDEKGYFKNRDKLYFGGINGFTEINTLLIKAKSLAQKMYVYKIEYYEGSEKKTLYGLNWNRITLPSKTKLVTLYICSTEFPSSSQRKFFYKFSAGRDSDFIPVNDLNKIDINITGYGNYYINIASKNAFGNFSDNPLEIQFYILPKWHQTWWFKSLIALFLIAIVYGLYRIRVNQLRKEEKIRNQLASDLHDDLGSTLNSIKVHSNLAMMDKNNSNHLLLIKQGTQDAINGVRDIIWVLDDKKDLLGDILTRVTQFAEPLCFAQKIQYRAVMEDESFSVKFGKEEKRNLYMIMKESINNSLKYAECSNIIIQCSKPDKKLKIEISDDGRGFESLVPGTGYGLQNIRNRAKLVGYQASILSEPGKGTRIVLQKI